MNTERIKLNIEGQEFECEVEFKFIHGEPPILDGHPDNPQPETPDEWEISGLTILIEYPHTMTAQQERKDFLNELRENNGKLSKRSMRSLKAAWYELGKVKGELSLLKIHLKNAIAELQKRGSK